MVDIKHNYNMFDVVLYFPCSDSPIDRRPVAIISATISVIVLCVTVVIVVTVIVVGVVCCMRKKKNSYKSKSISPSHSLASMTLLDLISRSRYSSVGECKSTYIL